jgi:hypothetical protein
MWIFLGELQRVVECFDIFRRKHRQNIIVGDSVKYPLERWDVLPTVYLSTIR